MLFTRLFVFLIAAMIVASILSSCDDIVGDKKIYMLEVTLLGIAVVLILIFGFLGPIGWLELFADIIDGLSDIDWFD